MTKEEIQKSIDVCKANREAKREEHSVKQDKKLADRKEGIAFIHENEVKLLTYNIEYTENILTIGAVVDTIGCEGSVAYYRCAFALCSSTDRFSDRIAKGLVGKRLKDKTQYYTFSLGVEKNPEVSYENVLNMAVCWIKMLALSGDVNLPYRLVRVYQQFAKEANNPMLRYIG